MLVYIYGLFCFRCVLLLLPFFFSRIHHRVVVSDTDEFMCTFSSPVSRAKDSDASLADQYYLLAKAQQELALPTIGRNDVENVHKPSSLREII